MARNDACRNLYRDLIFAILGVKMRWCMITVIHPDDDPEKSRNFRHVGKLGDLRGTFNSFRRRRALARRVSDVVQKRLVGVYGANISARESKTLLWVTCDKLPNFFTILLLSIVLI